MRELTLRQTPASLEVFRQVFCLFKRRDDSFVNFLLVCRFGLREGLFLFGLALGEKLILCRARTLGRSFCEV